MIKIRLLAALLASISLPVALTGCTSDGGEGGVDMGFIRTPDKEKEKLPVVNEPIPLLFPTGRERLWKLSVAVITTQKDKDPVVAQRFDETVQVDAPRTIGGVKSATTLSMYQNGKLYRNEIYQVTPEALSLVAAGGNDKMVMSPPMVLLKAKAPEGAQYKWDGQITFQKTQAPAQAYSRVHAPQEITTPAGKFNAYLIDTVLTTIIEGRPVAFPSNRWIVPGIGIVKQNFQVGNAVVQKELTSYKGS